MKMTIVLLVVLGLVAAMCAVLLVIFLPSIISGSKTQNEITVLKAVRPISAHTDLTQEDLELVTINLSEQVDYYAKPSSYFTDMIDAVGKTVSEDIPAGGPITKNKIITNPDIATMLKALKEGYRAVSVKLSGDQISGGLLYPGCFVDVLAQFATKGSSGSTGEAVSRIFLDKIKVIAVNGVLASEDNRSAEGKTSGAKTSGRGGLTVTLVVATEQVESLQLATERGSISLALRTPLDNIAVNSKGTVLDPRKMTVFSDFFAPPANSDSTPDQNDSNRSGISKSKVDEQYTFLE